MPGDLAERAQPPARWIFTFEQYAAETEFMRRAALNEAQAAILNETVIRVSPEAYDTFMQAISAPAAALPPKATERLRRTAPWDR